ncbi:MAG: TIGR03667 family PPOX class F420-dependent oxidoreductase [Acidimicrobiia bacterium]|nr:TIGR03667 family PPOX class F420-dependent oxidoreductase [Acidimicrobiia bacterium]
MSRTGTARIDRDAEIGARAVERLEWERIGWLTTVAADGTPQTSPIWFLWDGDEFLLYSLDSARVRNLTSKARVSLNLDGNGMGEDIVVVEGTARLDETAPTAAENPAYLAKYEPVMDEYGWTPEWFAGRYSVPIRITPTKYRYW